MSRKKLREVRAKKVKEARIQEELKVKANWERIKSMATNFSSNSAGHKPKSLIPKFDFRKPYEVISLSSAGASTAKRSSITYTGNQMVGIATMHKSNMVPVFSEKDAVEVAKMRRG